MAERHDKLVAAFAGQLLRKKYALKSRAPFVDYRPDVYAVKGKIQVFAEIEIEQTIQSEHTSDQLLRMHEYLVKNKKRKGFLVVQRGCTAQASFLLESLFGDGRIEVRGL